MIEERNRAVANVLGVVLLVAIVLTGVTVLAGASAHTLTDRTQAFAGETARGDLSTLAETTLAVTDGGHHRERVEFSGTDTAAVRGYEYTDSGRITVGVGSEATGWTTVVDTTLGEYRAESGSTTIALQGGGVWRISNGDPATAEALRAPPVSAVEREDTTVTLPVYRIPGGERLDDAADVSLARQRPLYPSLYVAPSESIRITIESRFGHAWARVFEQSFPESDTEISVEGERVTVTYRGDGDTYLHGAVHRIEVGDT